MFSPMKLLILVVLIAAVWFGFKAIGRVRAKAKAAEPLEHEEHQNIDDNQPLTHAPAATAGQPRG